VSSTPTRDETRDPLDAFIDAACVPLDDHASGTLDRADAILAAHPDVATRGIHAAAILGDDETVRRFLERDPALARAKGGPRGWDALTHLCFSRYLRLDAARSEAFVRAARALLDAGADANTGWFERDHLPHPTWESAIYGAAGYAHHAELTRLLLERGADPNDEETPYHAPETYDNAALRVLVESRKLSDDSLAMILFRNTDWHDVEGIRWLLAHGVAADRMTRWGRTTLQNALLRDNSLAIVELLLDHGADPAREATHSDRPGSHTSPHSAIAIAAYRGRGDVLELLARRGVPIALDGVEALIAACARADTSAIREITARDPSLAAMLVAEGGALLAMFAGNDNVGGVPAHLDHGGDVKSRFAPREG
jgi:ankyrin repeat protein